MGEVFFPVHDLLRRRLQTGLVVAGLTLCVASTVFLLLFCARLGLGISSIAEGRLTTGFMIVLRQLLVFAGALVIIAGVATISFMVFFMMSQRVKDVGLMKAIGCPNGLIFGYLINELAIVVIVSCVLGTILGIAADFASTSLLTGAGFESTWKLADAWPALLVAVIFLVVALVLGAKPILDATKVECVKAMSPNYYIELTSGSRFRATSRSSLVARIAMRSLSRRKAATIRVLACLTTVFVLLTVTVAGGVIASQTTNDWIEKAMGRNVLVIGHHEMLDQCRFLYSKFYEAKGDRSFNYTDEKYSMPENLSNRLGNISGVTNTEERLVTQAHVAEVRSYVIDPETLATIPVGDSHERDSLIIGVEPDKVLGQWFVDGRFLDENDSFDATVGDSLAQAIFSRPLDQSMSFSNGTYDIVGVCIEPINNGFVAYVPLKVLRRVSSIPMPNMLVVRIDPSADEAVVVNKIRSELASENEAFDVLELDEILEKSVAFVGHLWSAIMLLPLFSLISASLCMTAYVMLAVTEQKQEFGVLRALGTRPSAIVRLVSLQNLVVLLSSYGVGVALGIMTTLMILVPDPIVTSLTVAEICGWLLAASASIFIMSLYPAMKAARASILQCIT